MVSGKIIRHKSDRAPYNIIFLLTPVVFIIYNNLLFTIFFETEKLFCQIFGKGDSVEAIFNNRVAYSFRSV